LFVVENLTLQKVDRKYLGSFEISAVEGQMDGSCEKKKYYKASKRRGISCVQLQESGQNLLVISYTRTAV